MAVVIHNHPSLPYNTALIHTKNKVHQDSTVERGCMIQWWRGLLKGGCDCRGVGVITVIIDRFSTALFSAREADSSRSCRMWFTVNDYPFIAIIYSLFVLFLNIYGSGGLTALFGCCMAGATWNRWLLDAASCVCTVIHHFTVVLHPKPHR